MPCNRVNVGGVTAIVCTSGRRKRCRCGKPATLECDWKVPKRKSGTCDKPICSSCAISPAPGKDICPDHAEDLKAWLASRAK